MAYLVNRTAYLEINSVPLATPAWRVLDLTPLYGLQMRGRDRVLPGATGQLATARKIDATSFVLPTLVFGAFTNDGTPVANVNEGLDDNIDHLHTNVVVPGVSDTTAAVWHRATGGTKSASIHVESFEPTAWGRGWVRFSLEISIPAGRFA